MATATERLEALTAAVRDTSDQLDKVKGEIDAAATKVEQELAALRDQIANGTVTTESLDAAEAAVGTLREKTQGLDDVHVDTENPETPVDPETPVEPEQPADQPIVSEGGTDGFGNPR